ncbi:fucolectin-6 [Patella vulgata]|uniref:fucolectin-6 n=1 Tax=Patella vulgata TaxID=6465 RepID=UPI0021809B59|nr:fucolectin-6 [Patella vulgata]
MAVIIKRLLLFVVISTLVGCIIADLNIALRKPTAQSSNFNHHLAPVSTRAVDGNTDGNYDHGSCTHTNGADTSQWWCVDLLHIFNITNIKIYNRVDAVPDRLKGFDLLLSSNGVCSTTGLASATSCYKDRRSRTQDLYIIDGCNHPSSKPLNSRFVYIHVYGSPAILSLCEVQVYVACEAGYYGPGCYQNCPKRCLNNICDDVSGKCVGCNEGRYGDKCEETCPTCCGSCRQLDGICLTGCKDGYWGPNGLCLDTCGYCTTGGCRIEDGVCYNGCKDGVNHKKCTDGCEILSPTTMAITGK